MYYVCLFVCDIGKHTRMYQNKIAQDITENNNKKKIKNNYYYFILITADDDGDAFSALHIAGLKQ